MQLEGSEYVCPTDGTRVHRKTTVSNRLFGALVFLGGTLAAVLTFIAALSGWQLTLFRAITIPFGMYCVSVLLLVFAGAGVGGILGRVDIVALFSRRRR